MTAGVKTARLAHTIAGNVQSTANKTRIAARTASQIIGIIPHPKAKLANRTLKRVAQFAGQVSGAARAVKSISRQALRMQGYTRRK